MSEPATDEELAKFIAENRERLRKNYLRGGSGEGEQMMSPDISKANKLVETVLNMDGAAITDFGKRFQKANEAHNLTQDMHDMSQFLMGLRTQVPDR